MMKCFLLGGGDCKILAYLIFTYDFKLFMRTILVTHFFILLYYLKYKSNDKKAHLFYFAKANTTNRISIIYLPFLSFGCFIALILQQFSG